MSVCVSLLRPERPFSVSCFFPSLPLSHLSLYGSVSVSLSVSLSLCLSLCLRVYLYLSLFPSLPVSHLSLYGSASVSLTLSLSLSPCLSISQSLCLSLPNPSLTLSLPHLSLSLCLSQCLDFLTLLSQARLIRQHVTFFLISDISRPPTLTHQYRLRPVDCVTVIS